MILGCLLIILGACTPQGTTQVTLKESTVPEVKPTIIAVPTTTPTDTASTPTATETQDVSTLEPTQTPVLVQIVVGTSFPTQIAEVQEVFMTLQKSFNETHTNIKILFRFPEAGYAMDMANAITWRPPPDIALGVGVSAAASLPGEWLDLTPYVEKDQYDLTRFVGPTLKIHSAQPDVNNLQIFSSSDQKGIIGLPLIVYPSVIFYNPEFFDQAQLAYPPKEFRAPYADGDPWTYDKLVEIAQKITVSANGEDALSPEQDPDKLLWYGWTHEYWEYAMDYAGKFGDGPGLGISSDYTTAEFNTQMFKDALQWDKDTVWKWHIAPSLNLISVIGDPFPGKRAAMTEAPSWYGYLLKAGYHEGWEIAAVPEGPNGKIVSITDVDMTGILKVSQHPQEAWEVLKWLYEPEQLKPLVETWVNQALGVPEDAELQKNLPSMLAKNFPQLDAHILIEATQYADLINHEAWRPNLSAVQEVMELAHRQVMSNKDADIDVILEEANAKIQALLYEYWKEHK
jgi:multiple sugar transport system substrate-binding protein